MYEAIMFDLDGTLLPMDYGEFTRGYFKLLANAAAPCGYDGEKLISAMWDGVAAMVKNDGSRINHQVFWETASKTLGEGVYNDIPVFDAFYSGDFHKARELTQPNPQAKEAVKLAREKAGKVVLATNPIFPTPAVTARLSWIGLTPEDFDLVTDYSNSCTCKPNPAYFKEICARIGVGAENCLMIGNNVWEDAIASMDAGMSAFLVTDCLINDRNDSITCPRGSFGELIEFLKNI